MIQRNRYIKRIVDAIARSPIVALLGPRQCGKTTLARMICEQRSSTYFDLESPTDLRRLENPDMMLSSLSGLVVIDEIQTLPELFPVLRVLVDRPNCDCQFLILGSASPDIIKHVSETLAGRVEFVDMAGFDLSELDLTAWKDLWIRGGFPRSYLAATDADSVVWREGFIRTFLQRDIPQLGINIPAPAVLVQWKLDNARFFNAPKTKSKHLI